MSGPPLPAREPDWFDAIPKIELHVHLEGAIPLAALFELVRKYDADAAGSLADLEARFRYRDFPHFIETWVWKNGFLRELDDFAFIAEAAARDLREQHVLYSRGVLLAAGLREPRPPRPAGSSRRFAEAWIASRGSP